MHNSIGALPAEIITTHYNTHNLNNLQREFKLQMKMPKLATPFQIYTPNVIGSGYALHKGYTDNNWNSPF